MVNLEINGKNVSVEANSTVMDAANKLGIYIPHFCYHEKLSIAANCRMCLVQVEKAPKPLPACATPVSDGMKVFTKSETASKAQKGVMELLLINHPLDCPICDQGGECQLQDLAVGYGSSSSRFVEKKRVVGNKNLGPLISAEEMSRCIHCTRCIRFGQEVAGVMELGMSGRGEHSEILSFVGESVDSELSGNMIDICPVGALTSKPFRYSARSWELIRRKSISPHDSLGSNLNMQSKDNKVLRVLPFHNTDINQCWLSDRDRYSYEGLNSKDRLKNPLIKVNNEWQEVDWTNALNFVALNILESLKKYGAENLSFLTSPQSTLEEFYLLRRISKSLGINNVDFRPKKLDIKNTHNEFVPWLGMALDDLPLQKNILIIGSNLRNENPLLALRVREAVKKGSNLFLLNPDDYEYLVNVKNKEILKLSEIVGSLIRIINSIKKIKKIKISDQHKSFGQNEFSDQIAKKLLQESNSSIFLGAIAINSFEFTKIHYLANEIVSLTDCKLGFFVEGANYIGGHLMSFLPDSSKNNNFNSIIEQKLKFYLLHNLEPDADSFLGEDAIKNLMKSEFVVIMSPFLFKNAKDYASVILPTSPFSETSGTFVNLEGKKQKFDPVVNPLMNSKPSWKILRVLANLLKLKGYEFETINELRSEIYKNNDNLSKLLNNRACKKIDLNFIDHHENYENVYETMIYNTDSIVRRADSLQKMNRKNNSKILLTRETIKSLKLHEGDMVQLLDEKKVINYSYEQSNSLAKNAVKFVYSSKGNVPTPPVTQNFKLKRINFQKNG